MCSGEKRLQLTKLLQVNLWIKVCFSFYVDQHKVESSSESSRFWDRWFERHSVAVVLQPFWSSFIDQFANKRANIFLPNGGPREMYPDISFFVGIFRNYVSEYELQVLLV